MSYNLLPGRVILVVGHGWFCEKAACIQQVLPQFKVYFYHLFQVRMKLPVGSSMVPVLVEPAALCIGYRRIATLQTNFSNRASPYIRQLHSLVRFAFLFRLWQVGHSVCAPVVSFRYPLQVLLPTFQVL